MIVAELQGVQVVRQAELDGWPGGERVKSEGVRQEVHEIY